MKFAAGAGVGILATPLPWKLLDDVSIWTQNWPWIPVNQPGETSYSYAFSKMDPTGVPMRVRLVGGRPVRVLPVDDHPLGGGVTSLSAAEVQMLYSPGRVKRPLMRSPDGAFTELTWARAVEILQQKLTAAGSSVACISGDETSSVNEIMSALIQAMGSEQMFFMPSEGQCAARAAALMGIDAQIGYDLENSDYILAIGADMLESWGTVVRNRRIFRESRPHSFDDGAGKGAVSLRSFAYAGAVQNNTAVAARPWLPIYPGTEAFLALGIASMLIARGRTGTGVIEDFNAFKRLAAGCTPEETARITGVDLKKLDTVVSALLNAKAPLVVAGSAFGQGAGVAPVILGVAINSLLGNINRPGGISLLPPTSVAMRTAMPREKIYEKDFVAWIAGKDRPKALLLHEANPVYALPNPDAVKVALNEVPFKVSFSTFMDETATLCDLVLPIGMGLERLDDAETPYGCGNTIYCISTPVVEPQENVVSTSNTLLHVAKKMGYELGFTLYEDLLQAKALYHEKCSFDALTTGQPAINDARVNPFSFSLRPEILEKILTGKSPEGSLHLAPYVKLNLGTAKTGIPPYNTKTLRSSELEGKVMLVAMNASTARKKGLLDGDSVMLVAGGTSIPAKLRVYEGVMNDTVAVCLGYGHTALDEFSQNKGANVMELLVASPEPETGLTVWSQANVEVVKV